MMWFIAFNLVHFCINILNPQPNFLPQHDRWATSRQTVDTHPASYSMDTGGKVDEA